MRTKALLIGIQYQDSKEYGSQDGEQFVGKEKWDDLDGPHHDVARMKKFLEEGPWQYGQVRVLLDKEGFMRPNRENIISSLYWLTDGALEDHRLFLHYSGHGSQAYTDSPSEPDHYDETLVPVDCPPDETEEGVAGMIRDNELREILVDRLPVGCHLTALFDCCHSGSILDLRYCYPRYLSIPYAWRCAGPASDSPRLNRTISDNTTKSNTLPTDFSEVIPADIEELKAPLPTAVTDVYHQTPTPLNPQGLPDPEEFDTPITKSSFFTSVLDPRVSEVSSMFRGVSLGELRTGRLRKMFQRRESSLSQALAFSASSGLAFATDRVEFGAKIDGHLRKLSGGSGRSSKKLSGGSGGKHKRSIALGLRPVHSTGTIANSIHLDAVVASQGMVMGPSKHVSMNAVDAWRRSIDTNAPAATVHTQTFTEGDDAFVCEDMTLSPTSTISAVPWRGSFNVQRSSVIQNLVNQALRTGEHMACYENPAVPSPFQTLVYDKPIKSRATFAGFYKGPTEEGPSPRVSSFSACYDDQAVFETGNGDGLLTSAFIKCMHDKNHEVTYGEMMAEIKKFFVRTNEERDPDDRFSVPPFPMLSSSYPVDLGSMVEI